MGQSKELDEADTPNSRCYGEDADIVALRIDRKKEKPLTSRIIPEGRPDENFTIRESDLHYTALECFVLEVGFPLIVLGVSSEIANEEDSLEVSDAYLGPLARCLLDGVKMETILVGKEVLSKALQ